MGKLRRDLGEKKRIIYVLQGSPKGMCKSIEGLHKFKPLKPECGYEADSRAHFVTIKNSLMNEIFKEDADLSISTAMFHSSTWPTFLLPPQGSI